MIKRELEDGYIDGFCFRFVGFKLLIFWKVVI